MEIYSTFSGQVVGGTCEYPIEGQPHIELFSDCGFNLTDDNGKAISVDEDGNFALGYLHPLILLCYQGMLASHLQMHT